MGSTKFILQGPISAGKCAKVKNRDSFDGVQICGGGMCRRARVNLNVFIRFAILSSPKITLPVPLLEQLAE